MAKGWEIPVSGALDIESVMMARAQQKERAARPYPVEAGECAQSPVQAARSRASEAIEDCYRTAHNLRSRLALVLSEEITDDGSKPGHPVSGSCELRQSFDSLAQQAGAVHEVLADILRRLEV